jgi:phage-related protein
VTSSQDIRAFGKNIIRVIYEPKERQDGTRKQNIYWFIRRRAEIRRMYWSNPRKS